jgi:membrane fusion protein, multidrug efflux system
MPEEPAAAWRRLMGRKLVITAVVVALVLVVGEVAARALLSSRSAGESGSQARLPPATAEVTRMTLVETKTVSGTLGYGDAVPVGAVGAGTLTWIAAIGPTVMRGEPLFKLDERPVVALYGTVPVYRTLRVGVAGVDVKQLEENLSGLGYRGFTVDDAFTAGTAAAVRDWQSRLGVPVTGAVQPGQVVFTPGPVRVAAHTARVGMTTGSAGGGATVLSYTDTTRLVTVDLKVADQALAAAGGKVTVTIPGGRRLDGTITKVGTAATVPDQGTQAAPGQSGPAADARIAVIVDIADQQALGTLEAAPVDVDFVSQKREGVLTVPVAALLALPQGGYGVEVVEGGTTRIVAVTTGLFAAGRVEINGGGIAAGMKVGMPR